MLVKGVNDAESNRVARGGRNREPFLPVTKIKQKKRME